MVAFDESSAKDFISNEAVIINCQMLKSPDGTSPGMPFLVPARVPTQTSETRCRLLRLTALLGLPLYASSQPNLDGQQLEFQAKFTALKETTTNPVLQRFSLEKSQASGDMYGEEKSGNFILMRADGMKLDIKNVMVLWTIISRVMSQVQERSDHYAWLNTVPSVSSDKFYRELMTPEAFLRFWEYGNAHSSEWAENGECPVSLGCKACGKTEGKLLRFGKCGVVKYCDQECQKGDLMIHKKICVKV